MTLQPLLEAPLAIQLHAFAAVGAFAVGCIQLAGPKGTAIHRAIGWSWVILMLVVAGSSFWVHQIRLWGDWSPIHFLSIFTLAVLPMAIVAVRRGRVKSHARAMIGLFAGALAVAGLLTFLPGRLMHGVLF
jgi:uncharacterized membrane protein